MGIHVRYFKLWNVEFPIHIVVVRIQWLVELRVKNQVILWVMEDIILQKGGDVVVKVDGWRGRCQGRW